MNYRRDKKLFPYKKILTILGFLILAYGIFGTNVGISFQRIVTSAFASLWRVGSGDERGLPVGIFGVFRSNIALTAENEQLKNELRDLGLKLLDRNLLFEENALLKEQLGRPDIGEGVMARVLSGPGQSPYDTIIIDIGSESGLRGGERVMYGDALLIGTIAEVHRNTSTVRLFSSSGEEIPVTIGEQKVSAIAVGYGGGNFEIKIPRDTPVKEGDVIVAPALMPHILGTVEYIESRPNDPFERILFKSPVPIFDINSVTVLLAV